MNHLKEYTLDMHRIGRASVAMFLSLAFAGAPVIAEQCLASCEAAHMAGGAGSSAHAGHHHAPISHSSISHAPVPCGHDHNGIVGIAASPDAAKARAHLSTAIIPASPIVVSVQIFVRDLNGSNSPPGTALRALSSPIRV